MNCCIKYKYENRNNMNYEFFIYKNKKYYYILNKFQ